MPLSGFRVCAHCGVIGDVIAPAIHRNQKPREALLAMVEKGEKGDWQEMKL